MSYAQYLLESDIPDEMRNATLNLNDALAVREWLYRQEPQVKNPNIVIFLAGSISKIDDEIKKYEERIADLKHVQEVLTEAFESEN